MSVFALRIRHYAFARLDEGAQKAPLRRNLLLGLQMSIEKLEEAKDGDQNVGLAFNGGKDCTVLLHLLSSIYPELTWKVCHVMYENSFSEVEEFSVQCQQQYNIVVSTYRCDAKSAFGAFLAENPSIRAVFVGVRRSDPFCENLELIQDTDNGWPNFVRVQPILNWSYVDVWTYLIHNNVPYCSLYNKGYTSLGDANSTTPNPLLMNKDSSYLPAYCLQDEKFERLGRKNNNRR